MTTLQRYLYIHELNVVGSMTSVNRVGISTFPEKKLSFLLH